jgi:hypothetical protein
VGKIGGPERVFGIHGPQVLVDPAQGLPAQSAQAGDQQADDQLRSAWRQDRTTAVSPTVFLYSIENHSPIDVRREIRIVRHKDYRPGFVF